MMSFNDDLQEVRDFCLAFPDDDLAIKIRGGLEAGLPLLRAQVDGCAAKSANAHVIGFELPEWLKVHLATIRARHFHTNEIVGAGNHRCVPHA